MCVYALPGATPAASKINFMQWLDAVVQGLTKHNTLVTYGGVRQYGFFHQILMNEFVNITSAKHSRCGDKIVDIHVVCAIMWWDPELAEQCFLIKQIGGHFWHDCI